MTESDFLESLSRMDASKKKRSEHARIVLQEPGLVTTLLDKILEGKGRIADKAAWVLELVVFADLDIFLPHLDRFTAGLQGLRRGSSIRPVAKICEYLTIGYFVKKKEEVVSSLNNRHLQLITTACFDWLIGDFPVAPKAYAMGALKNLSAVFPWVREMLLLTIEHNYPTGSAAYQARARHVLAALEKNTWHRK